jgi:hypothetical protein
MSWMALQLDTHGLKSQEDAIVAGIRALGGEVVPVDDSALRMALNANPSASTISLFANAGAPAATMAFVTGMRCRHSALRGFLRGLGIPLLVTERGYLRRGRGSMETYYQLGVGRLGWVPPGPLPSARFDALDLPLQDPVNRPTGAVLVLGQMPFDTSHGMDIERLVAWLTEQAAIQIAKSNRVIYRPHPLAQAVPIGVDVEVRLPEHSTLAQDLADAKLAVTYNSTAGVAALLAGVPIICSPTAHYVAVADYGHTATRAQVLDYMHRLAWAQWTMGELRSGEALRFVNQFAHFLP